MLAAIVERLGGELVGNPEVTIRQVATLESAGPGDIAFLARGRYRPQLRATRATAVILPHAERGATEVPRILCDDPYLYFARVSALLNPPQEVEPGVHPSAVIEPGAQVAASAWIGPGCHIGRGAEVGEGACIAAGCTVGGEARIGEASRLFPSVVVYERCVIGRRAVAQEDAQVLGGRGALALLRLGPRQAPEGALPLIQVRSAARRLSLCNSG